MLEIGIQRMDGVVSSEARNVPVPSVSPLRLQLPLLLLIHNREPAADEVLIKVIATDSNPKDWKASSRPG